MSFRGLKRRKLKLKKQRTNNQPIYSALFSTPSQLNPRE
jgi:hypothetical protein